MNADIAIIGGGIAGVYLAYRLSIQRPSCSIILLEKNRRLGGRIQTIKESKKRFQYEAGAGRISSRHDRLQALLSELHMTKHLWPIPVTRSPIVGTKERLPKEGTNLRKLLHLALSRMRRKSKAYLRSHTLGEVVDQVLSLDAATFLKRYYGYSLEFRSLNAWDGLQLLWKEEGGRTPAQYYVLKTGFSSLVSELERRVRNNGVRIHKTWVCKMVKHLPIEDCFLLEGASDSNPGHKRRHKIKAQAVVFAIPPKALCKFKILLPVRPLLKTSVGLPLTRVYATFPVHPGKQVWFKGLSKMTTGNRLQYIIPINERKGLIMIVYADHHNARFWYRADKTGKLRDVLMKYLLRTFPDRTIPRPNWHRVHYWSEGVHFCPAGHDVRTLRNQIRKDLHLKHVYICGEAFSTHQAWVEGALESADRTFKQLATLFRTKQICIQ